MQQLRRPRICRMVVWDTNSARAATSHRVAVCAAFTSRESEWLI